MSNKLDLFSLFEDVIIESSDVDIEVPYEEKMSDADSFYDEMKRSKLVAKNKSNSKEDIKGNKDKKEDDDVMDDKELDQDEEKEERVSSINLADAASYEKLIDDLNQFRAAHSFTDKEVSIELKNYFKKLTGEEKKVLHILLKSLIHITQPSLGVKGKTAQTPSDLTFVIKRSGTTSKEKKKSFEKRVSAEKQGQEVDRAAPIVVGEVKKQDKSNILKVLIENK
jgi:hypothetical protein